MKKGLLLFLGIGIGLLIGPISDLVRLVSFEGGDRDCLQRDVCVGNEADALTSPFLNSITSVDAGVGQLVFIICEPTETFGPGHGANSITPTEHALGARCHSRVYRLVYRTRFVHTVVTIRDGRVARIGQETTLELP